MRPFRDALKQPPLAVGGAIAALGSGQNAWVIAGVDERTNDSASHLSAPTASAPDILQALAAAADIHLFQFQAAVLVVDGQTALAFSYEGWKDLRPWGQTPTRRRDNHDATTDPTVDDDISAGYDVFSHWINTSDSGVFVCVDSTEGAAVWNELTFA